MSKFIDAVIFDCDGVLVDSEVLSMKVTQRVLAELGWSVDLATLLEKFVGCTHDYYVAEIEKRIGRTLTPGWSLEYQHLYRQAFDEGLQAIEGVSSALDHISLPTAVASNSGHERIRSSLHRVGLLERFGGRICSAEDVANGKPAPDVYLQAAKLLAVEPSRCVAVEDSKPGVEAALAAGMHVFAYSSSVPPSTWFTDRGIRVFHSMSMLPKLIDELSECGGPRPDVPGR